MRPGGLLPTIRSRCQMVRLTPLDDDELMACWQALEPPPPDDPARAAALAERAGGSAAQRDPVRRNMAGWRSPRPLERLAGGEKERHRRLSSPRRAVSRPRPGDPVRYLQPPRARTVSPDGKRRQRWQATWPVPSRCRTSGTRRWTRYRKRRETYNLDKKQHVLTMIDRLNRRCECDGPSAARGMAFAVPMRYPPPHLPFRHS